MFNYDFIFQNVVFMFLYVEQDVNLAQQSCSGLENFKMAEKNVKKNRRKKSFCSQEGMGLAIYVRLIFI